MIKRSSQFSNGAEYEFFKECWCEKCKHYKVRDDGFPEFPTWDHLNPETKDTVEFWIE